jgi:hypothetical protein
MENPFAPRYGAHREPHPRQVAFEGQRVRQVLDRFGLSRHAPELVRRFQMCWGQPRLTFESFFEFFPTFPVLLEAHSFYHVAEHCRPAALFRGFEQTFLLRRYLDLHARAREEAAERPTGLVLPFDGYRGGMVLHDGDFATAATRLVHDLSGERPPHRVTLEPFAPFLDFLARGGWTPETPLPARRRVQGRRAQRGAWIRPWMVHLLGLGPDTLLLAFLLKVLRSQSGHDRRLVRVHHGDRYVAIDHRELAAETGLSKAQVKRGLESLRGRGLVAATPRQDGGQIKSHFRVDGEAVRRTRREPHLP